MALRPPALPMPEIPICIQRGSLPIRAITKPFCESGVEDMMVRPIRNNSQRHVRRSLALERLRHQGQRNPYRTRFIFNSDTRIRISQSVTRCGRAGTFLYWLTRHSHDRRDRPFRRGFSTDGNSYCL